MGSLLRTTLTVIVLMGTAALPVAAENSERQKPERPAVGSDTIQGEVVVGSYDNMVVIGVDTFTLDKPTDGLADRVFFFESNLSLPSLDWRGFGIVEVQDKALKVRRAKGPDLIVHLGSKSETPAENARVIPNGAGILEQSRFRGEELGQVVTLADEANIHVRSVSRNGDLSGGVRPIFKEDNEPPIDPPIEPECASSCSVTCGDGSNCNVNCSEESCAECDCGPWGATCRCAG